MSTAVTAPASSEVKPASRKVCLIGAGYAGLAAARELRQEGHAVTVLEQSADVGGQWLYDHDPNGHSSIYASLRVLSPRELMGFSGFQFLPRNSSNGGRDARRFPGHREVQRFLRDFCDASGLLDSIRFRTRVLRVSSMTMAPPRHGQEEPPKWVVKAEDQAAGVVEEEVFDAVVVATGHYSHPRLPRIDGMAEWGRRQLHSHWYRVPEPFRGETVVIVGSGDSGRDIALDILAVAKEVHIAAKSTEAAATMAMRKTLARHPHLHLHPQVRRLCADGQVVFSGAGGEEDSVVVLADSVVYCTGYRYSFPFLDADHQIAVDEEGGAVAPLFEHTFPPSMAPWLSFVGVPRKVPVPWFFEAQGRWIARALSGRTPLPPEPEMTRRVQERRRAMELQGVPVDRAYHLQPQEVLEFWEKYCGDLPPVEEWKSELMEAVSRDFEDDMETFRDRADDDDSLSENVRMGLQRWYGLSAQAHQDQDLGGGGAAAPGTTADQL
ncbi:hypothetical protein BRADI_5g02930v3 [Brachypodium distachyon]|uniref:Flavin-containing monooxygenase n=2 Tax=Brachypodium distachyon TaxID=15368 RepID=A0A0Q3H174_BRADI|nr:hypothetical protein BRADI_5g02930v3 [Brachypodium distachyon]